MIHRFETIDSTNNYAKELATQGAPGNTFVIANQQTGGRGRMGRSFHSPEGKGLYLSMILRPQEEASELMHLTCAAAVAACDAVEATCGSRPGIKWTNDLVCNKQKLGGILTELGFNGSKLDYAIIGIGINCSHEQTDFPSELQDMATSLSLAYGNPITPQDLEPHLISALTKLSECLSKGKSMLLSQYRKDCITLGKEISILQGENIRHGKAIDMDDEGGLIVELSDGKIETIAFGEVSVRGMYHYL